MRVLFGLHADPDAHSAGVEVHTAALASELAGSHEVALLLPAPLRGRGAAAEPGVRQTNLAQGAKLQRFFVGSGRLPTSFEAIHRGDEQARRDVERVLDAFRPDVVHIQHWMGLSSELPELAQSRNIPVVMTVHDHGFECAAGGQRFHREWGRCEEMSVERCAECTAHLSGPALRTRAALARMGIELKAPRAGAGPGARPSGLRHVVSRALRVRQDRQRARLSRREADLLEMSHAIDRFLVPSDFMARSLIRFGVPRTSVRRIEFGLPDEHAAPPRTLPAKARKFGYLGTLAPHKGVHLLIDAFRDLPSDVSLDIYGDPAVQPAYAKGLRSQASHPGIAFRGALAPRDVPARLRELDALVVPSLWDENAPLVILEAFAAGLPVVASERGGIPELIGSEAGARGLLFEPDRPGELASALRRLVEEEGLLGALAARRPAIRRLADLAFETGQLYDALVHEFDATLTTGEQEAGARDVESAGDAISSPSPPARTGAEPPTA